MTKEFYVRTKNAEPTAVGEMLSEEFLKPLVISLYELANMTGIAANRIENIIKHRHRINKHEGLLLAKFFHTDDDFWINLQKAHDLWSHKAFDS